MIAGLKLIAWFGTFWGRIAGIAAVVSFVVVARQVDKANLRNQGAQRAVEKIEKANEKATDLGKKAAAKSRAPAPPGRVRAADRDPTTRDD